MKITIDSKVLEKNDLSIADFAILLYYIGEGKGIMNEEICDKLWQRNLLIKELYGFKFNFNNLHLIESISSESSLPAKEVNRTEYLAEELRKIYPEGKKEGTIYYWRDSVKIISQRLQIFLKKYGNSYSNESIINATKKYVESFNGDYRYMQLLKYFIRKKNMSTGEDTSELLSYLENEGQDDNNNSTWSVDLK